MVEHDCSTSLLLNGNRISFFMLRAFIMTAFIMMLLPDTLPAQQLLPSVRFRDFVFTAVTVTKNQSYAAGPMAAIAPAPPVKQKYFLFDFYEPSGDTAGSRPLIIWLHGGGFKFGNKTSGGLPLWSNTFARRGYVCACINYRLSKRHPLKSFPDLILSCADAIEDLNRAIVFFKQHAQQYKIDTSRIILGGNSAGGMIALQAVYSSPAEMMALAHPDDAVNNASTIHNPQQVAAVINCWGALFNINWLRNGRVPIVSIHGSKDRVVPYDDRKPPMNGSLAIHRVADSLQINNRLKIFDGYGHELQKHFNPLFAGRPARKRWLAAGQFAADFLYDALFR